MYIWFIFFYYIQKVKACAFDFDRGTDNS